MPKGPGYRAVTRHADVTEASRHPEIYRSGQGATSIPDMPEEMLEYFGSMISTDNPRHARLRRIVSAAFNPRMIKRIEEHIELVAGSVIDRVAGLGGCDFVVEVAARLPLEIICEMMGIGPADYGTVFNASNIILSQGDPEYVPEGADPLVAFMTAAQDLTALMAELAEARAGQPDRRRHLRPGQHQHRRRVAHRRRGGLLLHPAGRGGERDDPQRHQPRPAGPDRAPRSAGAVAGRPGRRSRATGVDEIVRWGSPVIWMRRTVAEDTVLGGEELHPGDKLILFYNSANRDEDVFEDPYRFDVRRTPQPARRVRRGRAPLLPGRPPGPPGDRRDVPSVVRAPARHRARRASRTGSARSFINGIKHMDCTFTPVAPAG